VTTLCQERKSAGLAVAPIATDIGVRKVPVANLQVGDALKVTKIKLTPVHMEYNQIIRHVLALPLTVNFGDIFT